MKTIQELAKEAESHFQQTKRGEDTIYIRKPDAPEWVEELVQNAHGERGPSDSYYDQIIYALRAFQEYYEPEIALDEVEPNPYTGQLTAWLAENIENVYYLTQALEEFGSKDGFQALATAQTIWILEIYESVLASLQAQLQEEPEEVE